jgi:O-methyltransferase involved in polyketide biosynthesis
LKLACGLSPRGYIFSNKNKNSDIRYIEADLPGMTNLKMKKSNNTGFTDKRDIIIPCYILAEGGELSVENILKNYFNPDIPTAVISEWLVNHFDIEILMQIWKRVSNIIKFSKAGEYLFDYLVNKTAHPTIL